MKSRLLALIVIAFALQFTLSGQTPQLPPASAMKPVGLVGGLSWYSTVDYYRYINEAVNDAYGDNTNPPILLYNLNQQEIHAFQLAGKWDEIANVYADAIKRLQAGGAQAILLCSNTSHKVYPQVARMTSLPILHMGDATGSAIRAKGLKKVGLIGTLYTMEDDFMIGWLRDHYGIETIVPESHATRVELHRIIQKELDLGIFKPESKKYVLQQIAELRRRGAQGIVLGCTEFPLIIKPSDVDIPTFDTTRLHAQMAVDFILGKPGLAHVRPEK